MNTKQKTIISLLLFLSYYMTIDAETCFLETLPEDTLGIVLTYLTPNNEFDDQIGETQRLANTSKTLQQMVALQCSTLFIKNPKNIYVFALNKKKSFFTDKLLMLKQKLDALPNLHNIHFLHLSPSEISTILNIINTTLHSITIECAACDTHNLDTHILYEPMINSLALHNKKLTSLSLYNIANEHFYEALYQHPAEFFPVLTSLTIDFNDNYEVTLHKFVGQCPQLKELTINNDYISAFVFIYGLMENKKPLISIKNLPYIESITNKNSIDFLTISHENYSTLKNNPDFKRLCSHYKYITIRDLTNDEILNLDMNFEQSTIVYLILLEPLIDETFALFNRETIKELYCDQRLNITSPLPSCTTIKTIAENVSNPLIAPLLPACTTIYLIDCNPESPYTTIDTYAFLITHYQHLEHLWHNSILYIRSVPDLMHYLIEQCDGNNYTLTTLSEKTYFTKISYSIYAADECLFRKKFPRLNYKVIPS